MNKGKGRTVDLLYTHKKMPKGKNKLARSNKKKKNKTNTMINLDNEIVIGLTPKRQENKQKSKTTTKTKIKNKKRKSYIQQNPKTEIKKSKKVKKQEMTFEVIKWTSILALIIVIITLFMMSDIFNIKQIIVLNNNRISSQEIIKLSKLITGINMFKTNNIQITKDIKTNAYIEDIHIKRKLNGTVIIEVKERVPTYMLKYANAYVYINNQGYILQITEAPLELPIITGFATPIDQMKEGYRLIPEDLVKLEDVIKIIESSKNISLANKITKIDISDSKNYILTIESELKTVQFGDINDTSVKLLKIEALLEQEKGIAGEIYFQGTDRTIFREEVKR